MTVGGEMSGIKAVRGMRDFLPEEAGVLKYIEGEARRVAGLFGYREVVTPVVEAYELLAAKAGEEIRSRMFAFKDLGGRDVALRPEFTASVARLVATAFRNEPRPFRLFSVGSLYRYDEPQRGRHREFWQSNYELMGSGRPEADAEILMLTDSLMRRVGLKDCVFKVGQVGVLRGIFDEEKLEEGVQNSAMQLMDKRQYDDALRLVEGAGVSEGCMEVLRELVNMKGDAVFDVVEEVSGLVSGYRMSVVAVENLRQVLELVKESESGVDVVVEAGFARGLEYYTGLVFEVNVPGLNVALAGGGRYDRLIECYGGESTPAVGVAHGLDRIMLALELQKAPAGRKDEKRVVVVPISGGMRGAALRISEVLRDAGVAVEVEVMGRRMAKALEDADRRGFAYAVLVGERELSEGAVVLRDLGKREQRVVKVDGLVKALRG
jgi:histidyl-tRNA synthetase